MLEKYYDSLGLRIFKIMDKKRSYVLTLLPGDGIGPEVMNVALNVLHVIGDIYKIKFEYTTGLIGGCAIDELGTPVSNEVLEICQQTDAVLLGGRNGKHYRKAKNLKRAY